MVRQAGRELIHVVYFTAELAPYLPEGLSGVMDALYAGR